MSATTVHVDVDGRSLPTPEAYVLVRFDGADTVMLLRWLGPDAARIGARAAVAWRAEHVGSILDIDGVVPVS